MTGFPDFPDIPHIQFPLHPQPLILDVIGPLLLSTPEQPKIKAILTALEGIDPLSLHTRRAKTQRVIDLHVADLMANGPGQIIRQQSRQSHPKNFLQRLKIPLDMERCAIQTFGELGHIFGPSGLYPHDAAWPMVKNLNCLAFQTTQGTVLIPCLDAWRFVLATSSTLLSLSTRSECRTILKEMREASFLETPDGQKFQLPLESFDSSDTQARAERVALLKASTLHLMNVPSLFTEAEIPFLAWCMTDEPLFQAVTRFYPSILASKIRTKNGELPQSAPTFRFPFQGAVEFHLQGTWLSSDRERYFLALHLDKCLLDVAFPARIIHPLGYELSDSEPVEQDAPEVQYRHRRPHLDEDNAKVDSLTPPTGRLAPLRYGLRRDRFPHLKEAVTTSRNIRGPGGITGLTGDVKLETEVSSGEIEGHHGNRRKLDINEKPVLKRPVDHKGAFKNLQEVCKLLIKNGFKAHFLPLTDGEAGDPTTLIPSVLGSTSNWLGKQASSRRALIALIEYDKQYAYALEWERFHAGESGKLLLCTALNEPVPEETLMDLLRQCAQKRGVWPTTTKKPFQLIGIVHRPDNPEAMSKAIQGRLATLGWQMPRQPKSPENIEKLEANKLS